MKRPIFMFFIYALCTIVLKHAFAKCFTDSNPSDYLNAILYRKGGSCESELIVNIHISPSFDKENSKKFWVLDETYETTKRTNVKILSPYLIAVSHGVPISMYPLQFVKSIKDKEIVKDFNADINYTMNHDDSSPCKSQLPIVLNGIESEQILRLKRKSRQANLKKKSGISKKLLVRKRKENDKETLRSSRINTYGCNHNFNANLGLVRIIKTSDKIDQPEASTDIPDININHIFQNIQDNSGQTQEMEFKKNCFKKDYIEMYKNANRHTSALSEGNTNPYDKDSAKENKKKYIEDYQLNDDCEEKNVGSAISQNKIKKTIPLSSKENHLVGVSAANFNIFNKEDHSIQKEFLSKYYIPDHNKIHTKVAHALMTKPLLRSSMDHYYRSIHFPQSKYMKINKRNAHYISNIQNHKYIPKITKCNSDERFLKNVNDNDEIPCDTCGGKNKNSRGKSQNKYESNLTVSKNQYDFNPCHIKSEYKNRSTGKLIRQSCGCFRNPNNCDCEKSKPIRDLKTTCKQKCLICGRCGAGGG